MTTSFAALRVVVLVLAIPGFPTLSHGASDATVPSRDDVPVHLTTEHTARPLDVDVQQPRLSWQYDARRAGLLQRAYQIVVATDPDLLDDGRANVWDSGRVDSTEQTDIPYEGVPLQSNTTYYWAVRAWTSRGSVSPFSPAASFETGLLSAAHWTASWIGRTNPPAPPRLGEQSPAPLLRKTFVLDKPVARARLRISGLGFYVAFLNGRRVGTQVLDPPPSAFDRTALYATHDVTTSLRTGNNAIGVMLGRGYFADPVTHGPFALWKAPWHSEPRLLAQIDVTYEDGTTARIASDGTWTMSDAPIVDAAWMGERYDARLEQPGWSEPAFDASSWTPAPEQAAPTRSVRAMAMQSIEITETLEPVAATVLPDGATVYDFGRVIAGWARLSATGSRGTTITLSYGETLNPDGTVYSLSSVNGGDPVHVDAYTLAGRGTEVWEPSFARHGFRFVQVSASPDPPRAFAVVARVNHTAVTSTGSFECSDELLNRLQRNQRASLLANLWGFPTDTPWRDRMGWTADAWLYLDSAALNFDVQRLYEQWLRTFRESQTPKGGLPVIAPFAQFAPLDILEDPSWSGTIILIAWGLHEHYGDTRVLRDNYDAMSGWMTHMIGVVAANGYVARSFSFGDWLSPGTEANPTPLPLEGVKLTATADLFLEARTLARVARLLGHDDDARTFDAFADRIAKAFNDAFLDRNAGVYRTQSDVGYRQTSNLVPLAYGLVPDELEPEVYANLVRDIEARGNHLDTGAIGTKRILPVLTERGDADLAFAVATQTTYPGWGYWVLQGATTSWEAWSQARPDLSLNHAFLGTFDDWLHRHLAGIRPLRPGYAAVRIAPIVPEGLDHVRAAIRTPHGVVESSWQRHGRSTVHEIAIPGNTLGEVRIPVADGAKVRVDGRTRVVRRERGATVFAAGPGRFTFAVDRPARRLPTRDVPH